MKILLLLLLSFSAYSAELLLTTPEPVSTKMITRIKLVSVEMHLVDETVVVTYCEMGVDGPIAEKVFVLSGAGYDAMMSVVPEAGKTRKENIQKGLLMYLQGIGKLGTII
jgi:rhodanese-related sulfurtransferase